MLEPLKQSGCYGRWSRPSVRRRLGLRPESHAPSGVLNGSSMLSRSTCTSFDSRPHFLIRVMSIFSSYHLFESTQILLFGRVMVGFNLTSHTGSGRPFIILIGRRIPSLIYPGRTEGSCLSKITKFYFREMLLMMNLSGFECYWYGLILL